MLVAGAFAARFFISAPHSVEQELEACKEAKIKVMEQQQQQQEEQEEQQQQEEQEEEEEEEEED